ncbi:MAG: serine/threonine protein kinase, partial [Deltaproteobacteria bacterium]
MGERFGPYELLDKIGEGGMAEVWKARATGAAGFQRILVVKKILPMFANNKAFIDMLVTEAKLCSSLHHPNIVPIFDLGEIDGVYFVTMEYVEGVDLLRVLQRAARRQVRVPTEIAVYIAGEVARALAYAHGAVDHAGRPLNIIHRDVSPANIMIGNRGEVKLTDFGVARADLEAETRLGAASVVRHDGLKGKLSYMSPELVSGTEIDHRSDIFAVGTLIYEMLTLKRLFMGKSELQTMANVRKARITRRMERHEYIPRPVQDIIRTALARDPDQRYQSADALYEAVQDYLFEARLRVGPQEIARFLVDLFPSRAPVMSEPRRVAHGLRRWDLAEDELDDGGDDDMRTERTERPSIVDEELDELSGLRQPPRPLSGDEVALPVAAEEEAEAEAPAEAPADPVDALLVAMEQDG